MTTNAATTPLSLPPKHEDWLPTYVEGQLERIAGLCRLREQSGIASDLQGVIQLVREMNQHRLEAEQRASLS